MMQRPELRWTADIIESFRSIDKGVNDQPMLVVAYLVISVFNGLMPGMEIIAKPVGQAILLGIACSVIRAAWLERLDEEARKEFQIRHGGTPVPSLIFVQALFYAPLILPVLFLLGPLRSLDIASGLLTWALSAPLIVFACWWSIKSALAIVIISIEDCGAASALLQSHRLLNGRFWSTFRYLLPIFIVLNLPMLGFWTFVRFGFRMLMDQAVNLPITVGAMAVKGLLEGSAYFAVQLLIAASLTRLYAVAKESQSGKQSEIQV